MVGSGFQRMMEPEEGRGMLKVLWISYRNPGYSMGCSYRAKEFYLKLLNHRIAFLLCSNDLT